MYLVFVSLVCFSLNARGIAFTGFSRTVTPKSIQFTSSALGQVKGLAILCFLCLCERMPIACGVGLIDAVEEVLLVCTCSLLQSLQNKCSLFSSTKRKKEKRRKKEKGVNVIIWNVSNVRSLSCVFLIYFPASHIRGGEKKKNNILILSWSPCHSTTCRSAWVFLSPALRHNGVVWRARLCCGESRLFMLCVVESQDSLCCVLWRVKTLYAVFSLQFLIGDPYSGSQILIWDAPLTPDPKLLTTNPCVRCTFDYKSECGMYLWLQIIMWDAILTTNPNLRCTFDYKS